MDIEFYWEIITYNGEVHHVRRRNVKTIQSAIKNQVKHIEVNGETIAVGDIRLFRQSDKVVTETSVPKLADGMNKTGSPMINPETGGVWAQWVKTYVTSRKWDSYYASSPGYYRLGGDGNNVIAAYRRPMHHGEELPDHVFKCDFKEAELLESWRKER